MWLLHMGLKITKALRTCCLGSEIRKSVHAMRLKTDNGKGHICESKKQNTSVWRDLKSVDQDSVFIFACILRCCLSTVPRLETTSADANTNDDYHHDCNASLPRLYPTMRLSKVYKPLFFLFLNLLLYTLSATFSCEKKKRILVDIWY